MKENFTDEEISQIKELFEQIKQEVEDEQNEDFNSILDSFDDENANFMEETLMNEVFKRKIRFKKINSDAVIPKYNYPTDSGFDLHSTIDYVLPPFGRALIPTGLCVQFDDGLELQVRTKSGLAINQGLIVLNSPGTVDQGYSGEIKIIVFNVNNQEFKITKGMKVAQGVICPVLQGNVINIVEVQNFTKTDRQDNGFGSTGI